MRLFSSGNRTMNKKTIYALATSLVMIVFFIGTPLLMPLAEAESPVAPMGGIWSRSLEESTYATPTAANRAVYVGSNKGVLYVLDATSGKLRREFKTDFQFPCYPLVSGDGNVYLTTNNGALYALNAFTGKLEWSILDTATKAYSSPPELPYYYVFQPAQSKDLVFFSTPDSKLYAVETDTGFIKWEYRSKASFITYPVVSQGKVYIGDGKGVLHCFDADNGEKKWDYLTEASIHYPPAIKENEVFLGSTDGILHVINARTGKLSWKYASADSIESSPVIEKNSVYVGTSNGKLFSLNIKKRHLKWKFDVEGFVVTQPLIDRGLLYVSSNDGKLYALDADEGEPLWAFDSKGNFLSQVAVADGRLFTVVNTKIKDKPVSSVLAFKSGLYPGVKVTIYAGKENPLLAWMADFLSAPAKDLLRSENNTFSGEMSKLLIWPLGFYNTSIAQSLTAISDKSVAPASHRKLNNALTFIIPGISICGFSCLLTLTPFILILLSGFLILFWTLLLLAVISFGQLLSIPVFTLTNTGIKKNKIAFPFSFLKDAFALTVRHFKLVIMAFFQSLLIIMLSWTMLIYLRPIEVWSFYLIIMFIWMLAIFLSCLMHAYCLIRINDKKPELHNSRARYHYGRILALSLTYILLGFIIIVCLGVGGSYKLYLLSATTATLVTLMFILLPYASNFAIINNQPYFPSIRSSIRLALSNFVPTLVYLSITVIILAVLGSAISLINTLQFGLLPVLVSLFIGSVAAVYLICLQSTVFNNLVDEGVVLEKRTLPGDSESAMG